MNPLDKDLTLANLMIILCAGVAPQCHAQGGVPLWTNVSSGFPWRMAVDDSGNVFVTGQSLNAETNYDYVTIKYSSLGIPLWTNRYHGPANGDDTAMAIAVDGSGNVFVTGESGWPSPDYATIKYSSLGVPLWTNRYHGPGNSGDTASAIAVDRGGNVFVTGYSHDSLSDYVTIAYSSAGVPLWTNRYDGANNVDHPSAIAVDASGNVFVTGGSSDGSTLDSDSWDFATVAYSNAGVPLWTNRYDGANAFDRADGIAVDSTGNVFVTGTSSEDFATVAYSNAGLPLWTNRYGPAQLSETPTPIAVDSSGNVFVTGDSATVAYSNAGLKLWTRLYTAGSLASAIAVDSSGNVFVTRRTPTGGGPDSSTTFAYSNSGVPLWTKRVANVLLFSMAVDRAGNVFVNGSSSDGTNGYMVTIKYSSSIPLPRLDFQTLNNKLVLSWTNAGFTLQSAPSVTGTFKNIPGARSPYTNPISAPQQFFRLAQ